ncbi:MAG TPA: hypothetical protein VF601_17515 [Beijerinckiaceae bacterium]|jgi:hypothetical protein
MSNLSVSGAERRWPALVLRLVDRGTQRYPPKVRRRLKILNAMAYLIAVFSLLFAVTYALEDFSAYRWAVAINLALTAAGLVEIKGVGRQETFFLIGPRAAEPVHEAAA